MMRLPEIKEERHSWKSMQDDDPFQTSITSSSPSFGGMERPTFSVQRITTSSKAEPEKKPEGFSDTVKRTLIPYAQKLQQMVSSPKQTTQPVPSLSTPRSSLKTSRTRTNI